MQKLGRSGMGWRYSVKSQGLAHMGRSRVGGGSQLELSSRRRDAIKGLKAGGRGGGWAGDTRSGLIS